MSDEDVEKLKRELSKDQFTLSDYDIVGSGLSETFRPKPSVSDVRNLNLQLPPPWSENRNMVLRFLNPIFDSVYKCPGRNTPQCCGAEVTQTCRPNWIEKEDIQWYALRINSLLSNVDDKICGGKAPAAAMADEAFELGTLFEEARLKFLWDVEAKIGKKIRKGGKEGGGKRRGPYRKSPEMTVAAVNALRAKGLPLMAACSVVAEQQRVSLQTIRKEYSKTVVRTL